MHIRPVQPADRDEWFRMRDCLWTGSSDDHVREIDAFFATSQDGVTLVVERPDGGLCGLYRDQSSELRRGLKIDVKGKAIIVYTADQSVDTLVDLFKDFHPDPRSNLEFMTTLRGVIQYSPMMQFVLDDKEDRLFTAQRYCFMGSIDDWIDIDYGQLAKLVRTYVKHLGNESYFELF